MVSWLLPHESQVLVQNEWELRKSLIQSLKFWEKNQMVAYRELDLEVVAASRSDAR